MDDAAQRAGERHALVAHPLEESPLGLVGVLGRDRRRADEGPDLAPLAPLDDAADRVEVALPGASASAFIPQPMSLMP